MANQFSNTFLTMIVTLILVGTVVVAGIFGSSAITNTGNLWQTDSNAVYSDQFTDSDGNLRGGAVIWYDVFGADDQEYTTGIYAGEISGFPIHSIVLTEDTSTDSIVWFYFQINDLRSFTVDRLNWTFDAPIDKSGLPLEYYDLHIYSWGYVSDTKKYVSTLELYSPMVQNDVSGFSTWSLTDNIQIKDYGTNFDLYGFVIRINLVGNYPVSSAITFGFQVNGTADLLYPSASSWQIIAGGMGLALIVMAVIMTDYVDLPSGSSRRSRGR